MSDTDISKDQAKGADSHGETTHHVSISHPHPTFTKPLIIRYMVFLVMEAAFTALAWYCFRRPRLLPSYVDLDLRTVKSGFITIFNIWHTVAIACAIAICAETFSKEWSARPDQTDAVSTVTSGITDRIYYSFTRRATRTFRAAFLIFLGLIVMRITGSSAVTATDEVPVQATLPISLISTPSLTSDNTNTNNSAFALRLTTANMIVRLEQLLEAPWGYVIQPNWLIPLPTEDLNKTSQVDYGTDLAKFNYTCRWQVPDNIYENTVIIGNETWTSTVRFSSLNTTEGTQAPQGTGRNGSSIFQLIPRTQVEGTSAYLLLGGNSSVPVNSTSQTEAWIDLSGLPSMFSSGGFTRTRDHFPPLHAPLATLLICDPRLGLTSGTVRLRPTPGLQVHDVTVLTPNIAGRVGNIDDSATRTLFANVLTSAINQPDSIPWLRTLDFIYINAVSARMLLSIPPTRPLNWSAIGAITPLDLVTINHQLNDFTLSALKAFTSGDKGDDNAIQQVTDVYATVVDAKSTSATLALATSIQFAILHSVLFTTILVALAGLAYLNRTQGRVPFDLKSIKIESH
ncbi:hypothetical protein D9756_003507 [Leucocoprinus leucothites]|uniref:Transmembrane protein n=1 Tax=Leucocoprinus leucothites TaxID=201217 RepID=A0A8H5G768_9AGAR|nr:hypothetical protein D9756_003507 [Leucoagaricus leucothites]